MRQSTITTFYAHSAAFIKEHIDKVMTMLNCSASTMSNYYDRRTLDKELRETQESVLLSPKLITSEVKDRFNKADEVLKGLVNEKIISQGVVTSTRTPRLTVDDTEWATQYEEILALRAKGVANSFFSTVGISTSISTTSSSVAITTSHVKKINLANDLDGDNYPSIIPSASAPTISSVATTTSQVEQIDLTDKHDDGDNSPATIPSAAVPASSSLKQIILSDNDEDIVQFAPQLTKKSTTHGSVNKKKVLKNLTVGERCAWYGMYDDELDWLERPYLADVNDNLSTNSQSSAPRKTSKRTKRKTLFSTTLYSSDD